MGGSIVNATCILVEGKDDIAFVRRLVDKERQSAGLSSLHWMLLNENDKVIINDSEWIGNCVVSLPTQIVAIMEVKGIYKIDKALDMEPVYGLISIGKKEYQVNKYVCIFDADSPVNFLGNQVNYGGVSARRKYVHGKMSASGRAFDIFLLSDNASDTTLEDLVSNMINSKYQFWFSTTGLTIVIRQQEIFTSVQANRLLVIQRNVNCLSLRQYWMSLLQKTSIGFLRYGMTRYGIGTHLAFSPLSCSLKLRFLTCSDNK